MIAVLMIDLLLVQEEIVSFRVVRACVRARGAVCKVSSCKKSDVPPVSLFPFSLLVSQPFPFSLSSNRVVSVS